MLYDKRWEETKLQDEWRTVLKAAADLVEQGWCRGACCMQRDGEGLRFCAMGAIRRAAAFDNVVSDCEAGAKAVTRLEAHLGVRGNLVNWNDHHAKDGAEVAARMREAAKIA